jgi:predicted RNA binding protein YcfA (HicA-like mRNA interferase family)
MTGRLPTVTAKQTLKALLRAGFIEEHQRGSHLSLYHPLTHKQTTIPMHGGDLNRSLLKAILKQAGITEEEFKRLL